MRKRGYLMICVCMMLLYFIGCGRGKDSITFETASDETVKAEDTLTKEDIGETDAKEADTKEADEKTKSAEQTAENTIYVYVCGEVISPGVYEFTSGMRVADAIVAAGGMTEEAAETYWNQAAVLEDGQKIYVPTKEEAAGEMESQSSGQVIEQENKINLNTAGKEQLMTLSGVGSAKADAIIAYRKEQGGFRSIEDIMKIEGIKEGVFKKIKDKITVE